MNVRGAVGKLVQYVMAVVAGLGLLSTSPALALPVAPEPTPPVSGIAQPCRSEHPWPSDAPLEEITSQLSRNWGFELAGSGWSQANRESIKVVWQTLDAVSCTTFVEDLQGKVNGNVGLNASHISGFAWGDWGRTRSHFVTLDFSKFAQALAAGDEGRLSRLVIHELAHVLNSDRYSNPDYWQDFQRLYAQQGRFSDYAGSSISETFADVVGYYVGRCADGNPYDTGQHEAYYEFAKQRVFGGREFGPPPGAVADCKVSVPETLAQPGMLHDGSWLDSVHDA